MKKLPNFDLRDYMGVSWRLKNSYIQFKNFIQVTFLIKILLNIKKKYMYIYDQQKITFVYFMLNLKSDLTYFRIHNIQSVFIMYNHCNFALIIGIL